MGRKKKGADLQAKLDSYLKTYELDEINSANDMASLIQMCQLEINLSKLNETLDKLEENYGKFINQEFQIRRELW
jgi:hypothetical protein